MKLSKKQQRDLVRLLHIIFALFVGGLIYAPAEFIAPLCLTIQIVLFPALGLTGLWMWQGTRLLSSVKSSKTNR
jgi:hypothetical protein